MTVKTELQAILDKSEHTTVQEIEIWARKAKTSDLHHALKYDDEAGAAQLWRLGHIRQLIAIHIVDVLHVRETISLTLDRGANGYRHMSDVLETPNLRSLAVRDLLADLVRLKAKNEALGFDEFEPVWEAIDLLKERFEIRRPGRDASEHPSP